MMVVISDLKQLSLVLLIHTCSELQGIFLYPDMDLQKDLQLPVHYNFAYVCTYIKIQMTSNVRMNENLI